MVSARAVAALATLATLGTAAPALAGGAPAGPPIYPSLVNERLVRVQAALDRATASADEHQPDAAAKTLMNARTNLKKAWTSARYVIDHAPPPVVATDAAFHPQSFTRSGRLKLRKIGTTAKVRARMAGGPVGAAGGVASIYDTAFAVLSLQHRMATLATGLIDTAHGPLLSSLSTSLFTALDGRDQAIEYLHSIDTPAPPATDARVRARAAGQPPATSGWATVMPNLVPMLDDEIQQVNGTIASGPLRTGTRHVLLDALAQDTAAQSRVDQLWPPLPPADD